MSRTRNGSLKFGVVMESEWVRTKPSLDHGNTIIYNNYIIYEIVCYIFLTFYWCGIRHQIIVPHKSHTYIPQINFEALCWLLHF